MQGLISVVDDGPVEGQLFAGLVGLGYDVAGVVAALAGHSQCNQLRGGEFELHRAAQGVLACLQGGIHIVGVSHNILGGGDLDVYGGRLARL